MARNTHAKTSWPTGELAAAASVAEEADSPSGPAGALDPPYDAPETTSYENKPRTPPRLHGEEPRIETGEKHTVGAQKNAGKLHEGLSPSPWDSLLYDSPTSSTRRPTGDSLPTPQCKLPPVESTSFSAEVILLLLLLIRPLGAQNSVQAPGCGQPITARFH